MLSQVNDLLGRAAFDLVSILRPVGFEQTGLHRVRHLAALRIRIGVTPFLQRMLELLAKAARGPAQVRFEDLPDVHARWHAQRVEHDVDMGAVL